jgi:hypothetical protein
VPDANAYDYPYLYGSTTQQHARASHEYLYGTARDRHAHEYRRAAHSHQYDRPSYLDRYTANLRAI